MNIIRKEGRKEPAFDKQTIVNIRPIKNEITKKIRLQHTIEYRERKRNNTFDYGKNVKRNQLRIVL